MLRVGRSVDESGQIAHALQLLLQTIQRPDVNSTVATVDDLDSHRWLSRRGQDRIGDIAELVQSSYRVYG